MPTTILDGETFEQAKERRFREEAEDILVEMALDSNEEYAVDNSEVNTGL